MLPSSTVENYLKAIYQGTAALAAPATAAAHGPAGRRRSASRPAPPRRWSRRWPSRASCEYEPYAGVALTPAGREARRAGAPAPSSDRAVPGAGDGLLVGRGARRGRATRARGLRSPGRPHGRDARPARGRSARRSDPQRRRTGEAAGGADAADLPARTRPITVTRVIDQDKAFLRFIEQHNLKPGEPIEVEARDAAADSVRSSRRASGGSRLGRGPRRSCWCRRRGDRASHNSQFTIRGSRSARCMRPGRRRRARPTARPAASLAESARSRIPTRRGSIAVPAFRAVS